MCIGALITLSHQHRISLLHRCKISLCMANEKCFQLVDNSETWFKIGPKYFGKKKFTSRQKDE
jgi:hypothetical protein